MLALQSQSKLRSKKMIVLTPKYAFKFPIEGKSITPDIFAQKSVKEIKALEMYEGNRKVTLGELFNVKNAKTPSEEPTIKIEGDVKAVRDIGYGMSTGKIIVDGDVGFHLGEAMSGGTICVNGNAGSWAGSRMSGGTIEIKGNAGDYIGAAYRGSTEGMSGGTVIIHGNAGHEVGCFMRKGLIRILGNVGIRHFNVNRQRRRITAKPHGPDSRSVDGFLEFLLHFGDLWILISLTDRPGNRLLG